MKTRMFSAVVVVAGVGLLAGCAGTQVKRVDREEVVDLSGRWNDTDARMVAQEMINDCLNSDWLPYFQGQKTKKPVVIVGSVKNNTGDHINADVFMKELERSLLRSGKVKFVSSRNERGEIREERIAQNTEGFTAPETVKAMGRETGADYMLTGTVNDVQDSFKNRYVILYQANLELTDLETNEKVWIGQKNIKKVVKKSKYSL